MTTVIINLLITQFNNYDDLFIYHSINLQSTSEITCHIILFVKKDVHFSLQGQLGFDRWKEKYFYPKINNKDNWNLVNERKENLYHLQYVLDIFFLSFSIFSISTRELPCLIKLMWWDGRLLRIKWFFLLFKLLWESVENNILLVNQLHYNYWNQYHIRNPN